MMTTTITPKTCYQLLDKYGIDGNVLKHVKKVEKIATHLGKKLKEKEKNTNLNLITTSALLHDIGKKLANHTKMNHIEAGTIILKGEELPEHAEICRTHSIYAFYTDAEYPKTWEAKIVNYADKRVIEDKIVTLDERLNYFRKKINKNHIKKIEKNLKLLEQEILEKIQTNIKLDELKQEK
ncbi:MAG: HD domain-containing protein [Candidatus Woesearchaeota archaeon]